MYRGLYCIAIIAVFTLQMVGTCRSADIRIVSEELDTEVDCNIRLNGRIEVGDAERLTSLLSKFSQDTSTGPYLCLDSEGGDFAEAILIVEAILQPHKINGVHTVVDAHKSCLSACAFIFMAGMECIGTGDKCSPARSLHVTGRLGFHAPRAEDIPGAKFDDRTLATAYKTAILQLGRLSKCPSGK
jgi:hypothetical protein